MVTRLEKYFFEGNTQIVIEISISQLPPKCKKSRLLFGGDGKGIHRTYSMTTQRLGSTPVEWVVMFSISCRAAWIT